MIVTWSKVPRPSIPFLQGLDDSGLAWLKCCELFILIGSLFLLHCGEWQCRRLGQQVIPALAALRPCPIPACSAREDTAEGGEPPSPCRLQHSDCSLADLSVGSNWFPQGLAQAVSDWTRTCEQEKVVGST